MSLFQNARDNIMHFQDSSLIAFGGDQQISGSATIAGPQNFAGGQTIYQAASLKGALSLLLVRLTAQLMNNEC